MTYVEPIPEPTTAELQREAQEEAQVFASLGMSADAAICIGLPADCFRLGRPVVADIERDRSITRRQA